MKKLAFGFVALIVLGFVGWRIATPEIWWFENMREGPISDRVRITKTTNTDGSWKWSVVANESFEVFTLGPWMKPEFRQIASDPRQVFLFRYYGSGSSSAYYYHVVALNDDGRFELLKAYETLNWDSVDLDTCEETPRKITSEFTVYGDCNGPDLADDVLTFKLPGYHCHSFSRIGGCPVEHRIRVW